MRSKNRFVFDTNVLVRAALLSESKAAQAFRQARQLGEMLSSVPVSEELNEVLGIEKFDHYLSREDRERFLVAFLRVAVVIEIAEPIASPRETKHR